MRLATARAIDKGVILVATVSLASRQYGFPTAASWAAVESDRPYLLIVLISIVGIFGVLMPFETIARKTRVQRRVSIRRHILATFGQLVHISISAPNPAPINDLGLHIWRRRRTLKHPNKGELIRVATYRLGSTPITRHIRPTLGKGVVGLCWELDQEVGMDVKKLAGLLADEQTFNDYREQKGVAAVMGFSWREFERYKHRGAVFASPVRNGRSNFVGCISFDAIHGYNDLNNSRMWHELNSLCMVVGQDGFENV